MLHLVSHNTWYYLHIVSPYYHSSWKQSQQLNIASHMWSLTSSKLPTATWLSWACKGNTLTLYMPSPTLVHALSHKHLSSHTNTYAFVHNHWAPMLTLPPFHLACAPFFIFIFIWCSPCFQSLIDIILYLCKVCAEVHGIWMLSCGTVQEWDGNGSLV